MRLGSARLWAADRAPYLSSALFALRTISTPGLDTFAVDKYWRLYADPACFKKWSVSEAGSVLIHEVHHLLRAHSERAQSLEKDTFRARRFNVAADIEINDDLADLELPASACTPAAFEVPPGDLAENYYLMIAATRLPLLADCGSAADGCRRDWELEPDEDAIGPAEASLIRDQVARAIKAAPGTVPGGLARWANAVLAPTVDWRRQLRGVVRAGVAQVSGAVDFTYSRPSRRAPLTRPSVVLPAMSRPVPRIAIVIDTSGSMSEASLSAALAEAGAVIVEAAAAAEPLAVIACDSDVRRTDRVLSTERVELVGGGGTDMGAGLAAAARLKPRPQLVVVLTDGFTPWPDRPPPDVSVVVGLIGGHDAAPAWAKTVLIPTS